jgi:hypothetical protein
VSVSSIPPANQFIADKQNDKKNNDPVTNLQKNNKQKTVDTKKNVATNKENKTTNSEDATTKSAELAKIVAKNNMV